MSFRCEFCGKAQPAGTKPVRVITKKREIGPPSIRVAEEGRSTFGNYSQPWEIAEEKKACPLCAEIEASKDPEVVEVIEEGKKVGSSISS